MSFKIGNRVRVPGFINDGHRGDLGTIINITPGGSYLILFDDFIGGHDGHPDTLGVEGKEGYCWYMSYSDLEEASFELRKHLKKHKLW